jgi:hypothetical protein
MMTEAGSISESGPGYRTGCTGQNILAGEEENSLICHELRMQAPVLVMSERPLTPRNCAYQNMKI